jgi:fatty acid desaturase
MRIEDPDGASSSMDGADAFLNSADALLDDRSKTFEAMIDDRERRRIRTEVSELSRLSPYRSILALAFDWMVIGIAIVTGSRFHSIGMSVLCIIVIGSRQHALLLIMHDAAHRRLHRDKRLNDWLSDVFCAFPLFVTTANYRASHFAHHRHTNTDKDPDWKRRLGLEAWRFPKTRRRLAFLFLGQVAGFGIGAMIAKAVRFGSTSPQESAQTAVVGRARHAARVVFYLCVLVALTYFAIWRQFLIYWILPIATSLPFLMRVRSIAEHFGLAHSNELTSSRNVMPTLLERPFLGLHSSHFHLDHHLYPSVPFYNLGRLHRSLHENEFYRRSAKENSSYFTRSSNSLWSDLVGRPSPS